MSYLDAASEPSTDNAKEWRRLVREKAAVRASKKPRKGEIWTLDGCRISEVKIISLKPLRGMAQGQVYRIKRSLLGEKVTAPSCVL